MSATTTPYDGGILLEPDGEQRDTIADGLLRTKTRDKCGLLLCGRQATVRFTIHGVEESISRCDEHAKGARMWLSDAGVGWFEHDSATTSATTTAPELTR